MTLENAIYIAYREVEKDSDNWRPEIDCEPVDVALIAAVAGGSALGIIIIAVISTFVGIAIRDRMAWKRWEKQRIDGYSYTLRTQYVGHKIINGYSRIMNRWCGWRLQMAFRSVRFTL